MNVYQDKRIVFSDAQYKARSNLAVCHWNENVDRQYTSVWNPKDPREDLGVWKERQITSHVSLNSETIFESLHQAKFTRKIAKIEFENI